jgi:hypothetical protein
MFQCSKPDSPPIGLDDLEQRATINAQKPDGLHDDPARGGGGISHRDYARALVLLIPRLRKAEAAQAANAERVRGALHPTKPIPAPNTCRRIAAQITSQDAGWLDKHELVAQLLAAAELAEEFQRADPGPPEGQTERADRKTDDKSGDGADCP